MVQLKQKSQVHRKKPNYDIEDPYIVVERLRKSVAREIENMTPERAKYLLSRLSMYNEDGDLIDLES